MANVSDITFVVQGPVFSRITMDCLQSIRQHLPTSKIILTTWNGADVSGLIYDELVLSGDPGFFYCSKKIGAKQNNVNRQITSTLAGLRQVKTKYAFKIRTDFQINGDGFLRFWNKFNAADKNYQVFQEKILACCYISRNPSSSIPYPYPFHASDLAFFGRTEDLTNLFDISLMTEVEAYWDKEKDGFNRYVPEQYILINCLRKNGKTISCAQYDDVSGDNIPETEKYFASNFVFLTYDQFDIAPAKTTTLARHHPKSLRTCYTHNEWLKLYQKHVAPEIDIPLHDAEREKLERRYRASEKYKRLSNIITLPIWGRARRRRIRKNLMAFFLDA